jgi:hypothetical protein
MFGSGSPLGAESQVVECDGDTLEVREGVGEALGVGGVLVVELGEMEELAEGVKLRLEVADMLGDSDALGVGTQTSSSIPLQGLT